jgi:ABC-type bacteriocin/lantibiotic exporter with double-glycine peptidase domain
MLRYAVLRILVFLAALALLWLLGLRGEENLLLLVVGAALLSAVVSFVALRRFREDTSAQIAARLDHRARSRSARVADSGGDEQVEDAEVEQRRAAPAQADDPADDDGDFR